MTVIGPRKISELPNAAILDGTELYEASQNGASVKVLGRYINVGSISPRMFGAALDGVTDDTEAWQEALDQGGDIVFDGDTVIDTVTASVDGTHIRGLGNVKIIGKSNGTTDTIRAWCNQFTIENVDFEALNSPSLRSQLWIAGDYYRVLHCRFVGKKARWIDLLTVKTGPLYGVYVGASEPTASGGYEAFVGGIIDDVYCEGGANGITIQGARRCKFTRITAYYPWGFGMTVGAGVMFYECQWNNFLGVGCGAYALSTAGPNSPTAQVEPVASYGNQFDNMYAENCGNGTFFGGVDGTVSGRKAGFDLVGIGLIGTIFRGSGKNNSGGGIEIKSGINSNYDFTSVTNAVTAAGSAVLHFSAVNAKAYVGMLVAGINIPSDTYIASFDSVSITMTRVATGGGVANGATITFTVNIQPTGVRSGVLEMNYVTYLDYYQHAADMYMEAPTAPSGLTSDWNLKVVGKTEQAPPWRGGTFQRPGDIVASDGSAWKCMGTDAGIESITGQTAPTGGSHMILSCASVGLQTTTLIEVDDSTGAVIGQTVFGIGVPSGATIIDIPDATHITLSETPSGTGIPNNQVLLCGTIFLDGGLYWFCMGTDNSGPGQSELNSCFRSYGCTNTTLDVTSTGFAVGIAIEATGGIDDLYEGLKCTARIRDSLTGIIVASAGNVTNATFVDVDVEARSQAFYIAPTGTNSISILGGRLHSTGSFGLRISAGINTVRLDGGVQIIAATGHGMYIDSGTNTIICGAVTFEGGDPVLNGRPVTVIDAGGALPPPPPTGTIDWGNAIFMHKDPTGSPGYVIAAPATMTTRGRVLRQDMSTAPIASTPGNVGEYMVLATPTATEWGYHCQAVTTPYTVMVWKKLALT